MGSTRKHTLTYGTNGLSSIVGPGSPSRTTTITVDGNQLLTKIKDPNNDSTVYGYASSSLGYRMLTVRDRRGFTTDFEYNGAWRLTKVKAPSVPIYPSGSARWQSVGLPLSGTGTPFAAPKFDTIQAVVADPESRATKFTVDKWGQQLVVKDPLNNTTTITRNADGLPTQISHPWGGTETMVYGGSRRRFRSHPATSSARGGRGALAFHRANEFKLTYMRARWYDADLGRFMSEHPIGLDGGINKYVFAGNDPVNERDPTGLRDDEGVKMECRPTWYGWVCTREGGGAVKLPGVTVVGQAPPRLVSNRHRMQWGLAGQGCSWHYDGYAYKERHCERRSDCGGSFCGFGEFLECTGGTAVDNFVATNTGVGHLARNGVGIVGGGVASRLTGLPSFLPGAAWEVFNRNLVLQAPFPGPEGTLGAALIRLARPAVQVILAYETGVVLGSVGTGVGICLP